MLITLPTPINSTISTFVNTLVRARIRIHVKAPTMLQAKRSLKKVALHTLAATLLTTLKLMPSQVMSYSAI